MTTTHTSTESRALALLGQGIGPEMVASAVGVSVSRISQLLSEPEFLDQVLELKYENLAKHNLRDSEYDKLEDLLLDKVKLLIPFMMRPMEVFKALATINAAKRRGASAPESITHQQTVISLIMPTQIINQYSAPVLNINNQVVKAGEQELVTVQPSQMTKLLELSSRSQKESIGDNHETHTRTKEIAGVGG